MTRNWPSTASVVRQKHPHPPPLWGGLNFKEFNFLPAGCVNTAGNKVTRNMSSVKWSATGMLMYGRPVMRCRKNDFVVVFQGIHPSLFRWIIASFGEDRMRILGTRFSFFWCGRMLAARCQITRMWPRLETMIIQRTMRGETSEASSVPVCKRKGPFGRDFIDACPSISRTSVKLHVVH